MTTVRKRNVIPGLFKQTMPLLLSLLTFSVLIFGIINYSTYKKDIWEKDVKARLFEILMTKKTKLEKELYSRIHYTHSVSAYVSLNPELKNYEFYNLAEELINDDSVISTMALSKDCIINAIYPIKGHEAALGLDLLTHPDRKEIVEKTIKTHKTFIAGPVNLVEGGLAFVSYTPIFDKSSGEKNKFWGVTDIVIYQNELLKRANINKSELGFLFALRGYNGQGKNGDIWWGNKSVFNQNPICVDINLPYGNWELAAVPEIGWDSYLDQDQFLFIILISSSLIISLLIWLISRALVRIKRNEQELNAIFKSMDSLVIEFDQNGRYVKIPPCNSELLFKPKEELLNKTVYEVVSFQQAKMVHDAILKCLKTKKLVEIQYSMEITNRKKWFNSRISWKSEQTVIFHAYDVTEQKNANQRVIESERRLLELNNTKDKFFSIIAHDLKSPFNVILGYSELLSKGFDGFDEEQRKIWISRIDEASRNTYNLLENLLLWANFQRGKIEVRKEQLNFKKLIFEAIEVYRPGADNKLLKVDVVVPDNLNILADKFIFRTIIANLFNNAVKFTNKNGLIKIEVREANNFIEFKISDNGVGMSKDTLNKLFLGEESVSSLGTENEKGTGLGLLLCKEFVENHEGKIWAESELKKGSTFYLTIPINE